LVLSGIGLSTLPSRVQWDLKPFDKVGPVTLIQLDFIT
jgi:hypothetical protein